MIDALIPQIEQLQAAGASVLLKWDGERKQKMCTVVVTRKDTDYVWRQDCDALSTTLAEALAAYWKHHEQ